ncbi:putative hydrolase or acyltransferase of alpha/beta superfamily [Saccharomonospora marina XMU15]|uniref:Putative hydrolase or acyltransferase of alpha/beta superfamily n=1 Tax=Saccharomonospora marina XMU15 TaxID=882083 RepID=H5XC23_9PSEU|nr:alpha/beta hydrolase [Saccharomonospora marina]EHR53827.1 putative hydrolase or acyltransferase of alpha/beta superfamily [Saccharomonospora marina XMU15]
MRKLRLSALVPALVGTLLIPVQTTAQAAQTSNSDKIPDRYTEQVLDWHRCGADELPSTPPEGAEDIECATFRTPRDWEQPGHGEDLTIAVSRLKATGGEAKASVLTNPGGPGAPGRAFPARLRDQDRVRRQQEIIGFDPRGTGKSTNITCGGAIGTGSSLDPRDRDRTNLNLILDATEYAADSCQFKSGELGPLVNTFQTVHDIDLLRTLLGREKINWVGYSAGTWLGAHYAQRFPEHTGRFVLDSATEFTTTWQRSFDWQPLGFERRWRQDFLPWLAKYDSLYHFGTTAERARQTYETVRASLAEQPIELDGQRVGPNEFDGAIGMNLYSKRSFPGLAEFLVSVRTLAEPEQSADEQASALRTLRARLSEAKAVGPQPLVVPVEYDDAYDASFWTIPCNEGPWFGGRGTAIWQSERLGRQYPLLGWGWLVQPCIFWKTKPRELPLLDGQGVPPVLIVQSEHDPATPVEGARRAHRAFEGSRMLTITDEGDHGIYAGGNACADDVVEDFLVDGIVPSDRTCPGQPLPVPEGS